METVPWLEIVPQVAMGIGLAACAGLRAWLPLLLAGLLARAGLLTLGTNFQFLASNRALLLFGIATVIEILGDKIPVVDHTLDSISTVLRPAAGSLLAASALWQVSDPLTAWTLGVAVGAPSALLPHATKSIVRGASTALTAGFANPILSIGEDVAAFTLFALTVVVPIFVASILCLVGVLVLRRLLRRNERAVVTAV